MTTIRQLLLAAVDHLSSSGLESPRHDAELILSIVTQTCRTYLITHPERKLTAEEEQLAWRWLEKRAQHYPIQYLRGFQEFYGHEFLVSPDVLVPRPETEFLIDVCLDLLDRRKTQRVLDIGTGSGCIAITLLLELPTLLAVATDVVQSALIIARANACRNACSDRLRLLLGDTTGPLLGDPGKFQLVVSNPPYVAFTERNAVSPSVARFEPAVAVFAGDSGLEIIEKLFEQVPPLLIDGGYLVLEIGYGQHMAVSALGGKYGWVETHVRRDLSNIERCAVFRLV